MLMRRAASALVLIPLVAVLVYLGGWAFWAALLLIGLLAGYEYLALLRHLDLRPFLPTALGYIAVVLLDVQLPGLNLLWGATWFLVALTLAVEVFDRNRPGSLASWSAGVAGALYIGLSLGHFVQLRALDRGIMWIALVLIGTWVSDSGAYFVGRAWGRRSLASEISPNKTWEGVWGGLVSGVITVWLISWLGLALPHWQGLILGLVLVVAATFGDLAESVIKRQADVKDSSNLIPGHGGMFDRVDSLLFVAPAVYYCMSLLALF